MGSDVELARALREGDEAALAAIYDRYMPGIYDFLGRFLRDPSAAEDVAQTTFIRAWEKRDTLRDPTRIKSWLYTIAHNLATNHVTRNRRTESIDDDFDLASAAPGPEDQAAAKQVVELVWAAAASLEPRQYAVLDLSVRRDLATGEIAQLLGIPAGHAAVLVNRAKEALGNAVRYLLVAQRRDHCPRLSELVPAGVTSLTPEQRGSVDRHMRRCPECQGLASRLTMPAELFGGLVALPIPVSLQHNRRDFVLVGARHQREASADGGIQQGRRRGPRSSRWTLLRRTALAATALLLLGIGGGELYLHRPGANQPNPGVAAGFSAIGPSASAPTGTPGVDSPIPSGVGGGDQPTVSGGAPAAPGSNPASPPGHRPPVGMPGTPPSGTSQPSPVTSTPVPSPTPTTRPTPAPTPTPKPTPTATPTPTPSPSPSPSPTPTPTPTPTPPPFNVSQVTLAAANPAQTGCPQGPAGYVCDFTVTIRFSDALSDSVVQGSVTANAVVPGAPPQVNTQTFAYKVGPGTGSYSDRISAFFAFNPCAESSTAKAATQQPNQVDSLAVAFGRICTPPPSTVTQVSLSAANPRIDP